jgi:predicted Rossmann fold nucleotide-binding protein DprA/Smf involved in DNA uptake
LPDTIDSARRLIEARLRELNSEAQDLTRALQSLAEKASMKRRGRPRRKAATPRKSPGRPKRKAARAPRGQRREQFLAALKKSPGAKTAAIAKELGISPNQAHALAKRLHKDGSIRKSGKGYRLASSAVSK